MNMVTTMIRSNSAERAETGRDVLQAFSTLTEAMEVKGSASKHAPGAFLFSAGESARGVFMLRKGRVKLTMDSADGKTLILKVAKPGDFLDLGSCVLGKPHEVTAEVLQESELQFLPQQDFMRLIQKHGQVCLEVALLLGHDFHQACVELTMLGLSRSAESKLAGMLLRMMQEAGNRTDLRLNSTHEELAQLIGTSRETVTRVLSRLRRARIIEIHGSNLILRNPEALRRIENMEESTAPAAKTPMINISRTMHAACAAC